MRKSKDFVIRTIRINGHEVVVRSPTKKISLEEGIKLQRKILKKYI